MKKAAIIVLALVLLLAGCAKTSGGSETPVPQKTQAATEKPVVTEEPDRLSYLNLDGYKPIVKEGTDITLTAISSIDDTYSNDPNDSWLTAYIENVLNIKLDIEGVLNSARTERKNLLLSADELPDLLFWMGLSATDLVTYGQTEGKLLALNDYIYDYMPTFTLAINETPSILSNITCPDGNVYAFPRILDSTSTYFTHRIFVNVEWLENVNLDRPETLDDFYEMLVAFKKQDANGNGDPDDELPLGGCDKAYDPGFYVWNALGFMGTSYDTEISPMLRNGKVEILAGSELFREYLSFMNRLYAEGLIDDDFFSIDKAESDSQMAEGRVGVYAQAPYLTLPAVEDFQKYEALSPLTSEWNDTKAWPQSADYGVNIGSIAVSAATEYPEVIARLCDYLYTNEGTYYSWAGPQDNKPEYHFGKTKGVKVDFETSKRTSLDVLDGKFESMYAYCLGCVTFTSGSLGDYRGGDNAYRIWYGYDPVEKTEYDKNNGDQFYRYTCEQYLVPFIADVYPSNVYFSKEDTTRVTELRTAIESYVNIEMAKFITGSREISDAEMDKYYQGLKNLGFDEYQQFYIDAYENYKSAMGN